MPVGGTGRGFGQRRGPAASPLPARAVPPAREPRARAGNPLTGAPAARGGVHRRRPGNGGRRARGSEAAQRAAATARAVAAGSAGDLRLGIAESLTAPVLGPALQAWHRRHSGVRISLDEMTSAIALNAAVAENRLDLGGVTAPRPAGASPSPVPWMSSTQCPPSTGSPIAGPHHHSSTSPGSRLCTITGLA